MLEICLAFFVITNTIKIFFISQMCLGVLEKNENHLEDIIDIMRFMHDFTERDGEVLRTLSYGDELTCERELNAQEDMRDGDTQVKRMEGLIPCISDFHAFGNFLNVSNTSLIIEVDENVFTCLKI